MTDPLIQLGDWKLHSGRSTDFKLVADQFIADNLDGLVNLIRRLVGPFRAVYGMPRGGLVLADALMPYATAVGSILLVDDVLTTGGSLERSRSEVWDRRYRSCGVGPEDQFTGVVVFARGPLPLWVKTVFQLPSGLWGNHV